MIIIIINLKKEEKTVTHLGTERCLAINIPQESSVAQLETPFGERRESARVGES